MPILVPYNVIDSFGEPLTIYVQQGGGPVLPFKPSNNEYIVFNNADDAETAYGDFFNKRATVFVDRELGYERFVNLGFTNIVLAKYGTNYTLHFSDNKSITFVSKKDVGNNNYFLFRNGPNQLVFNIGQTPDYRGYTSDYDEYTFWHGWGLPSHIPYEFLTLKNTSTKAILTPCVVATGTSLVLGAYNCYGDYPAYATRFYGTEDFYSFPSYAKSVITRPTYRWQCYISVDTGYYEGPVTHGGDFPTYVNFLADFWTTSERQYSCVISRSVGGDVTPQSFMSKPNEPRMFIVTPDTHHAIYSVAAYNTETNAQIPLQESSMDLQTGAKSYMFTMPAANVRIAVEFRSIETVIPVIVKYTSDKGKTYTTSFNLMYDK